MSKKTAYFIDSGVADYKALIAGLPEGSAYYLLDRNVDGLEQISNILSTFGKCITLKAGSLRDCLT